MNRRYKYYIPKGTQVTLEFSNGVVSGAEARLDVYPKTGYKFKIKYFKLTTPPEVEANIILVNDKGEQILLAIPQDEDTVEVYDYSDFDDEEMFYLNSFALYAKAKTNITANRDVVLEFGGVMEIPYL